MRRVTGHTHAQATFTRPRAVWRLYEDFSSIRDKLQVLRLDNIARRSMRGLISLHLPKARNAPHDGSAGFHARER